jgi:5-methylcytosine-specific restriction enzyme A
MLAMCQEGRMARTKGHGNPNWTRDETILALDLYFRLDERVPSPTSADIQSLSAVLRSMPYHVEAARQPSFRNPDGVGFKLMNIRQVATGRGLGNVSAMDRQIWTEYGNQPDVVRNLADAIRAGIATLKPTEFPTDVDELPEGRVLTAMHLRRERHPGVRKMLLNDRRTKGICCDVCGFSRAGIDPVIEDSLFKAHHVVPLASAGERKTKLADLALLCACCHRGIHRAITAHRRWISVSEAREMIAPE